MGPPNASHRNSSRPKHESAKPTMISSRPRVGACFCMRYLRPAFAAVAVVPGGVEPGPAWLGDSEPWNGSSWLRMLPSVGLACPTTCSVDSVLQPNRIRPWRIGPCASWEEKIDAPAWLAHETQKR